MRPSMICGVIHDGVDRMEPLSRSPKKCGWVLVSCQLVLPPEDAPACSLHHCDILQGSLFFILPYPRQLTRHYQGTWVLTDEPVMEPPLRLKEALREKGIDEEGVFDAIDIGASRSF